jgi:hypothetical protein
MESITHNKRYLPHELKTRIHAVCILTIDVRLKDKKEAIDSGKIDVESSFLSNCLLL